MPRRPKDDTAPHTPGPCQEPPPSLSDLAFHCEQRTYNVFLVTQHLAESFPDSEMETARLFEVLAFLLKPVSDDLSDLSWRLQEQSDSEEGQP